MPHPIANAFLKALIRSPLHTLLGDSFAVISVTGRKTGRVISTPINVSREGDGFRVVSYRSRTWWRNLQGGRPGKLRAGGKTVAVSARIIDQPSAVADGLRAYFERYPGYAKYFGIHLGENGRVPEGDLQRLAEDRVMIHLTPEKQA